MTLPSYIPIKLYCLAAVLTFLICSGFSSSATAQSLENGGVVSGAIDFPGDVDTFTFSANEGEYVFISVVDIGETALSAAISISSASGSVITSAQGNTVSKVSMFAPASGVYTLSIRDNSSSGTNDDATGAYNVHYVRVPDANEHGSLVSGDFVTETVTLGDIDSWTFDVSEGEYAFISLVDIAQNTLSARIDLYDPDGNRVVDGQGNTVSKVSMFAPKTGTYTLIVADNRSSTVDDTGVGDYQLHYVRVPDANEHGNLVSGDFVTETVTLGDIDSWTFDVSEGEYAFISLVDIAQNTLSARIDLYDPDGIRVVDGQGNTVSKVSMFAPKTGTYTLIVADNRSSTVDDTGVGDYQLHYVRVPDANEHGNLVSGDFVTETVTLGDIDSWTFDVSEGEYAFISLVDIAQNTLSARIDLYDPDGIRVVDGQGNTVSKVSMFAPKTGTYTLIVADNRSSTVDDTGVGDYQLHYVRVPDANEHGNLVSGDFVTETVTLGDIDSWTFDVSEGEYAFISLVDIAQNTLSARIDLYDPDGIRVVDGQGNTVSKVSMFAPKTGTYTLIVADNRSSTVDDTGVGDYQLHYVRVPDANEHGNLVNGDFVTETVTLGDIDSWTFNAELGEYALISLADIERDTLSARLDLYDPDGIRVANGQGNTVSRVTMFAPKTGTYTLIVSDNRSSTVDDTGVGDYQLHYIKAPGANEHGLLSGVGSTRETITLGDLDSYTFAGEVGAEVSFVITDVDSTDLSVLFTIQSPSGARAVQTQDNTQARLIDFSLLEDGVHTLVVLDNRSSTVDDTGTGDYLIEYNVPEEIDPPEAPIASISAPSTVFRNEDVRLDGGASIDPDMGPDPLSYSWRLLAVPDGSDLTSDDLSDAELVVSTFWPDVLGAYQVELTVFDGLLTGSAETTIIVENQLPLADAGIDQNVLNGNLIDLDGSASSDPDMDIITYAWTIETQPAGASVSLSDAASAMPSFTPSVDGVYVFSLTVNDGFADSLPDTVEVSVSTENTVPVAVASASGVFQVGNEITLDASLSSDADGGPMPLTYTWQSIGDQSADIVDTNAALTTFFAETAGSYLFQLTVFDGEASDTTTVAVTIEALPANIAPVAIVTEDIDMNLGDNASLDGTGSFDPDSGPDTLSYQWSFVSVPSSSSITADDIVELTSALTSFNPDVAGVYMVSLRVFDGELEDQATLNVIVNALNIAPVADAGEDQSVALGDSVNLSGEGSMDPDSGPAPLTYLWQFISLPSTSDLDSSAITSDGSLASFTPDAAGTYEVSLRVSDSEADDVDTVLITVEPTPIARCDLDDNGVVDRIDVASIFLMNGASATGPDDPADWNEDGLINIFDARGCVTMCSLPSCATP
ncbi:PKD domain-containing protein [Ningiella sp. W23]|uniref:PKD domain-containing protein n=1 Tax=Ningiella sp. W23 TaxID=3023715 RepID=UPI003756EAA1